MLIKRGGESNYDVSKNEYMVQTYEAKMRSFVIDITQLDMIKDFDTVPQGTK